MSKVIFFRTSERRGLWGNGYELKVSIMIFLRRICNRDNEALPH